MDLRQLPNPYGNLGLPIGAGVYLNLDEARLVIEASEGLNFAVAGIEGMHWTGCDLTPDTGLVADFVENTAPKGSWKEGRGECQRAAADFLAALAPDRPILVSLRLLSEADWQTEARPVS